MMIRGKDQDKGQERTDQPLSTALRVLETCRTRYGCGWDMSRQSIDAVIAFIKHREMPERSPWDWTLIETVLTDMNVVPGGDIEDTGDITGGELETEAEMSQQVLHVRRTGANEADSHGH